MACQFREQDQLKMVEIDEQVIDIASNPKLFTYLRDCPSHPLIIKKDGLLAVSEVTDASNELLVMDAFSSDAIPVHFLTLEAFKLYQKKMTVDGAILVNITNRHLNVLPVITAAARALDMIILHKSQVKNESLGQFDSQWVLLTMNDQLAGKFLNEQGWRFVADADTQLWTNDYSNLIPLLK
jgi:spermidine synthase